VYFDLGQGADYIYRGTTNFEGLHFQDVLQLSGKQKEEFQKTHVADIFPEFYIIKVNKFNDLAKNTLDEWVYFLKNSEVKDEFKAKGLAEAKEVLDIMRLNAKAQYGYNRHIEALHLKASEALSLRIQQEELMEPKIEEAKVEIRKQALTEGQEKGLQKGREEGIGQEKINIAKMMLANGETDEKIRQYTGLTHEQLQALKNEV